MNQQAICHPMTIVTGEILVLLAKPKEGAGLELAIIACCSTGI